MKQEITLTTIQKQYIILWNFLKRGNKEMSYIVKKCPAMQYYTCEKYGMCQNCTDCVIKQVIEVCKKEAVINYPKKEKEFITVNGYQAILNMFDIEEIK